MEIERIQAAVADHYEIPVGELYSLGRDRRLSRARQMAMALAHELTDLSLPEIGSRFGGIDHTTVQHACRVIGSLRQRRVDLNEEYDKLLQLLSR